MKTPWGRFAPGVKRRAKEAGSVQAHLRANRSYSKQPPALMRKRLFSFNDGPGESNFP